MRSRLCNGDDKGASAGKRVVRIRTCPPNKKTSSWSSYARAVRIACGRSLLLLLGSALMAASPPAIQGVVNAASRMPLSMGAGGLAPGSLVTLTGASFPLDLECRRGQHPSGKQIQPCRAGLARRRSDASRAPGVPQGGVCQRPNSRPCNGDFALSDPRRRAEPWTLHIFRTAWD